MKIMALGMKKFKTKLKKLDMSGNNVKHEGMQFMSLFLMTDTTL